MGRRPPDRAPVDVTLELGTLADWTAAVASAGALIVALRLFSHEKDARRIDQAARREEQEVRREERAELRQVQLERRRAQAVKVLFTRKRDYTASECVIANYSDDPIADVQVLMWRDDGFDDGESGDPPGSLSTHGALFEFAAVPPHDQVRSDRVHLPDEHSVKFIMAAVFVDARGRLWRRWETGELEDLTELERPARVRTVRD